jgi:hypothetical protein
MSDALHTVELGHESDAAVVARLHRAVLECGGSMMLAEHDVGGMEESISYEIVLPEGDLIAVAETSLGLRLTGPETLVLRLALAVRDA